MIKISPSILSCDFSNLELEVNKIKQANAHMLHIDVMDGHFVNNISLGTVVIKSLRKKTDMFFDVHLMISNPLKYIDDFADAGADLITFHFESEDDIKKTIQRIKSRGIKVGLAVKPKTDITLIYDYLDYIDMVLVMTVEPGFGGQSFMVEILEKIETLKQKLNLMNLEIDIQVDGGINNQTGELAYNAGANVLVAGSYIFGNSDYGKAIDSLCYDK